MSRVWRSAWNVPVVLQALRERERALIGFRGDQPEVARGRLVHELAVGLRPGRPFEACSGTRTNALDRNIPKLKAERLRIC